MQVSSLSDPPSQLKPRGLSERESAVCEKYGGDEFCLQLRRLGFSQDMVSSTLRMLAEIDLKNPNFFMMKKRSVSASALSYAVYSYLKAAGLTSLDLNQRLVANLAPAPGVDPASISHVYRKILSEFRNDFPIFFGGSWNRDFLEKSTHTHSWETKGGLAYEERQSMTNEEYRAKHGVNWSDRRCDGLRRMQYQRCTTCHRSRRFLKYDYGDHLGLKKLSCPNPLCPDFALEQKGNLRLNGFRGRRKTRYVQCVTCKKRFSESLGTPLYDMRIVPDKLHDVLRLISEGKPIMLVASGARTTAETVGRILRLARSNREQFDQIMISDLSLSQQQIESFWKYAYSSTKP